MQAAGMARGGVVVTHGSVGLRGRRTVYLEARMLALVESGGLPRSSAASRPEAN